VALLKAGVLALWLVVLVVLRDVTIVAGVLFAKALSLPLRIAPLVIGKASTAVQVGYIGMVLLLLAFDRDAPRLVTAGAYTVAIFSALSLAAYAQQFLRALLFGRRTA
jgi:cardiolipin synthase (CMP-forming)